MRAFAAALLLLTATAAGAAERIELAAVGVLGSGGRATCTGLLIEPDLVLTAAHCLAGYARGGPMKPASLFFRTPKVDGEHEKRHAVDVVVHPLWLAGNPEGVGGLTHDLGLVVLDRPITRVPSLSIGTPPRPGEDFIIAGYPGAAGDVARERRCPSLMVNAGVLVLGCIVQSGESGSAVLRKVGDRIEIAAVIAATTSGEGQRLALAGAAKPRVRQLMALIGRTLAEP